MPQPGDDVRPRQPRQRPSHVFHSLDEPGAGQPLEVPAAASQTESKRDGLTELVPIAAGGLLVLGIIVLLLMYS